MSPEGDGKKIPEEEENRKRRKKFQRDNNKIFNFSTKTLLPLLNIRQMYPHITEKVRKFDASLLQLLLGKIA